MDDSVQAQVSQLKCEVYDILVMKSQLQERFNQLTQEESARNQKIVQLLSATKQEGEQIKEETKEVVKDK